MVFLYLPTPSHRDRRLLLLCDAGITISIGSSLAGQLRNRVDNLCNWHSTRDSEWSRVKHIDWYFGCDRVMVCWFEEVWLVVFSLQSVYLY